jgi:hypothetical protein
MEHLSAIFIGLFSMESALAYTPNKIRKSAEKRIFHVLFIFLEFG